MIAAKLKAPYWESTTIDPSGVENPHQISADTTFGRSKRRLLKRGICLLLVSAGRWNNKDISISESLRGLAVPVGNAYHTAPFWHGPPFRAACSEALDG